MIEKNSKEEFINKDDGLQRFRNINLEVLNQHAPTKKKYVRSNQKSFMIKQLSKEIMKRSKLCNNFLKNRTEDDRILYKKLRNYCLSILRKSKKEYYKNLNVREKTENKRDGISIKEKRKERNFENKIRNS